MLINVTVHHITSAFASLEQNAKIKEAALIGGVTSAKEFGRHVGPKRMVVNPPRDLGTANSNLH